MRMNMLTAAFKHEMVHGQGRVRCAVRDMAFTDRIERVFHQQCTRQDMPFNQRFTGIARKMGRYLDIASVLTGTLCCQQGLSALAESQIGTQCPL